MQGTRPKGAAQRDLPFPPLLLQVCPFCSNVNFEWREACKQCEKPKPPYAPKIPGAEAGTVPGAADGGGGGGGAQQYNMFGAGGYQGYQQGYQQGYDPSQQGYGQQGAAGAAAGYGAGGYGGGQMAYGAAAGGGAYGTGYGMGGMGGGGGGGHAAGLQANVLARPGDWLCSSCGNHNFQFRAACNKCGMPKPAGAAVLGGEAGAGAGGGGGAGGGPIRQNVAARPGDWICSCGNNNFAVSAREQRGGPLGP